MEARYRQVCDTLLTDEARARILDDPAPAFNAGENRNADSAIERRGRRKPCCASGKSCCRKRNWQKNAARPGNLKESSGRL